MQFHVPQNIDMEDRIVGPLTLVQFIYILGGSLIVYILWQLLGTAHIYVFIILGLPIALASLALTFLKIQDQPLAYFVKAGFYYLTHPKVMFWQRGVAVRPMIKEGPHKEVHIEETPVKQVEKSDLERLAHILDTRPTTREEEKVFGKITAGFEKLITQGKMSTNNQGGANGAVGQQQKPTG